MGIAGTASRAGLTSSLAAVTLLASALPGPARADTPSGEGQTAVWTHKELWFVYQGFTTHYSCDGLRDKVRVVLLDLGARKKDLQVVESACSRSAGRPDPFPGVRIKMSVLIPADGATEGQESVPAHWKPVALKVDDYHYTNDSGECELVEQVRDKILPLFTTRNLDYRSDCIPHQASPTGPSLKLEALFPDAAPDKDSEHDRNPGRRRSAVAPERETPSDH